MALKIFCSKNLVIFADPFEDQYAKRKEAKSERVAKNEYQRLRNIAKNSKGKGIE